MSRVMRIAYVCADPDVPVFGSKGSSVHVQEVIRSFLRLGAEVDLFAIWPDRERPPQFGAVRCHWLPSPPAGDLAARERAAQGANSNLWSALWREGPFDLVYERYSLWSFAGVMYAHLQQIPCVVEVNAPLVEEAARRRALVDRARAVEIAVRVFASSTAIVAVSEQVAQYVEGHPRACKAVHVVPNGVSPERFPVGAAPSLPASPGIFTIGFAGALVPAHGLDLLVRSFSILHRIEGGIRLLIVGDGPERQNLRLQVAREGVEEAVHFTGEVGSGEIPGLLASMDVGMAPYSPREDFYFSPLKIQEYMAAGLPVVASGIGQICERIDDGVDGLLCAPGDLISLTMSLSRLRSDPELCSRLGEAARRRVSRDRTWDAVAVRILEVAGLSPPAMPSMTVEDR